MTIDQQGDVQIVRMDASYSAFREEILDEAEQAMLRAVESSPRPRIVLDFSQTDYFSSMFIEVLFRVWNRVRTRNGRFAICALQPVCREILETAKLDSIWDIYPTVDEAVKVQQSGG